MMRGDTEPGEDDEPSLGALEGHTDQRAAWHVESVNDYELDHSESGIGDPDGLLEQVGTQDWQQGAMAGRKILGNAATPSSLPANSRKGARTP